MYNPRDSIRNAALDRKLWFVITIGNVKSAPTFNRTVRLNLHQWNADGIRPKFIELCDRLLNSDIDVLAVQESNLQKTDKTPSIEDHATIRKVRNNILGGGFYSLFERTLCSRNYTLSKNLAWRSCPFVSKLLNQLGLIPTMFIYQTPQLNIINSTHN